MTQSGPGRREAAPRVRAVVLNWNGGRHVLDAVDALRRTDWPPDRLDVVVVDNASSDGSDDALAARGDVELRRSPTNAGFPANNVGLADLDGVDYVALVNNDAFVEPGWLAPLVDALEDDAGVGAACPKLVFAPRFVELAVRAPRHPAPGDPRELALRVSGVEVAGVDRWRHSWFGPGCHGQEAGGRGEERFRWLAPEARLGLPLWDGAQAPVAGRVRLAAPQPVTVAVRWAGGETSVDVGPVPRWVEVCVAGEPFDVVQNAGSLLLEGGWGADRGFLQRDDGRFDEPVDVWAWCGGGVLLRPAYLADVGLFDERFFLYYEDTDL
ncbi:MAG: glycosyltransferase, partial [Acidimicrobiia bacterium]|nr:glycosyltransferase [Acidimicrobiia bacterium]